MKLVTTLAVLFFGAVLAFAAEPPTAKVIKVLPQYLDLEGRARHLRLKARRQDISLEGHAQQVPIRAAVFACMEAEN